VLSYVNDIVVASKKKASYISDLAKTFTNMHEAKLKLNPEKMCLQSIKGQGTWLSGLYQGPRSQPR
jgi:hypothetical protein